MHFDLRHESRANTRHELRHNMHRHPGQRANPRINLRLPSARAILHGAFAMFAMFSIPLAALLAAPRAQAEPLRYFGQTAGSYRSQTPYGNNPQAGKYADAGDARIYYEVYGEGAPVVVLHGGLVGSIAEMAEFIDRLRPDHKVIAIATRGHGKSETGPLDGPSAGKTGSKSGGPDYPRKAQDVLRVLAQEGVGRATLLGFSDGAYTGYFLAADYPEKVERLVAIGAGVWKRGALKYPPRFEDFARLDPDYWAQQQTLRPEPQRTADWYRSLTRFYGRMEMGKALFGKVRVPVLVLVGEDDQNAPLDTVIAAYRMLPKASLAIVPDAPHPVFMTNFPAVWASVKPFIDAPAAGKSENSGNSGK